ncbi:hypothetical protein D083_3541 [Dickeya solani RNS 08.23.3.1.A]|nr:hypothetical protein D083_3541 [Dickeya solani RNS 08.23.3.1.A]
MLLLFAAPGIGLRFLKAELTGGGHTDTLCQFQSFITEFRRELFTGLLID